MIVLIYSNFQTKILLIFFRSNQLIGDLKKILIKYFIAQMLYLETQSQLQFREFYCTATYKIAPKNRDFPAINLLDFPASISSVLMVSPSIQCSSTVLKYSGDPNPT